MGLNIVATVASKLVAKSHENGLKHLNMTNDGAYCALFVVNTPVTDNSGVAHGVEHFVFRRSLAFTQPESLFQITALTDVKMNASTLENLTYFHCQSQCQQTFIVALNYLLNGILHPDFHPDDLQYEIHDGGQCGVIYRELLGIETLQEHAIQQADKGKNQQDKLKKEQQKGSVQYGGDRRLIDQLTTNDLGRFHQQFYQAKDITLVTANTDFLQVSELIAALPESGKPQLSTLVQKPVKHQTISQTPTKKQQPSNISHGNNDKKNKQQTKYSAEINHLIEVYQQWFSRQQSQSIVKNKHIDTNISGVERITASSKNSSTQTKKVDQVSPSNVIKPLTELSTQLQNLYNPIDTLCSNTPVAQYKLPVLFNDLYQKAQEQLIDNKAIYVTDEQNGLFLAMVNTLFLNDRVLSNDIAAQAQSHIASHIISAYPTFLAPRCQGHCYLIQAFVIEQDKYLAIYSAFDVNAKKRSETIKGSLLQLSQDLAFINESIESVSYTHLTLPTTPYV